MRPIPFKEQNCVIAKDQAQYQPLPIFRSNSPIKECVSCWKLSWIERIKVLITGKIWVSVISFGKPLLPSYITTKKSEVLNIE